MNALKCLAAGLLLTSVAAAADKGPVRYRYFKPLERAASKEEEIVAFNLDSDVYTATRLGLPDLRVVDESLAQVPCLIEPDLEFREERSRQVVGTKILSLRPEGGKIEVRLRLPDNSPDIEGLTLATPVTNFERKVRVEGSVDGETWTPLVADGAIYDYSQFMDVSSREIPLPKNSFRDFKISIEDVVLEKESALMELSKTFRGGKEETRTEQTTVVRQPFRIGRIDGWYTAQHDRVQQARKAAYPIASFETKVDAAEKRTFITVRTRREPLTGLTLTTTSRDFSRRAVVEAAETQGDHTVWRRLAEEQVFNFSFRSLHRESLVIRFPEQRAERYRIVLFDEDNPPLSVTGVQAEGNIHRVFFLAQPGKSYRVFYGSETAEAPSYEAQSVLAALRQKFQPVVATPGAQTENTAFIGEPGPKVRAWLNNWLFLGTAIVLMVIVLGWSLVRAGKRLEGMPKEEKVD